MSWRKNDCYPLDETIEATTKLIAQNRPTNRPILPPGSEVVKPDLGPAVTYRSRLRPPLAGPYAFSRIPVPVWTHPRVFLMHDVASPWLFTNTTSGYDFLLFYYYHYYCSYYFFFVVVVNNTLCFFKKKHTLNKWSWLNWGKTL